MTKRMLIDATHAEETRVVVLDGNRLEDFDVETSTKKQLKGNIYLAKIVRVEPSLQAAFVEYGGGRHGFLAFGEIHPDYYQIPVADRQRLLAMQEQEAREEQEAEDAAAQADGAAEQAYAEATARNTGQPLAEADHESGHDAADHDVGHGGAEHVAPVDPAANAGEAGSADRGDEPPLGDGEPAAVAVHPAPDEREAPHTAKPAPAAEVATAADHQTPANEPSEGVADAASAHHEDSATTDQVPAVTETEAKGDAADAHPSPHRPAQPAMIPHDTRFGDEVFEGGHENHIPGAGSAESDDLADTQPMYSEAEIVADLDSDTRFDEESAQDQPPPATIGGESDTSDSGDEARERRSMRLLRNYRIQEVIRRRQIILVQVVKEERGTKGAALTTYISLAGRFCVLMPNSPRGGGISRKITSAADRRRLKEITAELDVPQGMGLIVRTAGAARPKPEIKRDAEYLMRLWDDIREHTMKSVAPALIYEEASLIKRSIRDVYSRDVDEILVDGEEGWRTAHDFMRMLMPSHAKKVQLWRPNGGAAPQPLFSKFAVEAQLDSMLSPTVQLKSGGYLVINQTEALVAIDVNSGRSTRERGIEETALRTNLEASDEVARQLRLRDLAGLIVIDYIDMEARKHNAAVERRLTEALKNDRARIQVGHISHFGLMEMSRQRLRPSLAETSFVMCQHCQGAGLVRSVESAAVHVLRAIEDEGAKAKAGLIMVHCANSIAMYLLNNKRDRLGEIELRYAMRVHFAADESLPPPQIRIDRLRPPVPEAERLLPIPVLPAAPAAALDDDVEDVEDEVMEEVAAPRQQAASPPPRAAAPETAAESEESQRRRRRRRRRGGRRDGNDSMVGGAGAAPASEGDAEGAPVSFEEGEFAFETVSDGSGSHDAGAHTGSSEPTLDDMAAGVSGLEPAMPTVATDAPVAAAGSTDEQPVVDPGDLDENGLPRARRRGRRGGRRRRRDGTFAEEPAAEQEAQASPPPAMPAYVGPTPADPFGGQAFDIFDMMDEVESRPVATVVTRPAVLPPDPAPHEPTPHVPLPDADIASVPVQASLEMAEHSEPAQDAPAEPQPVAAVHEPEPQLKPESVAAALEAAPAAETVDVPGEAAAEPQAAPVIQPIVIGQDPLPAAAPKKGWWRR